MRLAALLLATALPTAHAGPTDPIDFRGVPMGAPEAALLNRVPEFNCHASRPDAEPDVDRFCKATGDALNFGGIRAQSITARFIDDRLVGMIVLMSEHHFTVIVGGLREKFGKPTATESSTIQNRLGGTFVNTTLTWKRPGSAVLATRYATSIDSSSVFFADTFGNQQLEQRREQAARERAKSM